MSTIQKHWRARQSRTAFRAVVAAHSRALVAREQSWEAEVDRRVRRAVFLNGSRSDGDFIDLFTLPARLTVHCADLNQHKIPDGAYLLSPQEGQSPSMEHKYQLDQSESMQAIAVVRFTLRGLLTLATCG